MLTKRSRRTLLGGAGFAGLATLVYNAAPSFWQQYAKELPRVIEPPARIPNPAAWPDTGLYAAWLGHSTVLLKIDGYTILTDPVFSDRAGINLIGNLTLGVKRLVQPALPLDALPKVDLILLSHAHMDHFDIPSLRALESKASSVITAAQTSDLLRVDAYRDVRELNWDGRAQAGPVTVRAFQIKHWGARMRTDTYRGYNGYTLEAGRYRVLFAGDTAYTDLFRAVKQAHGYDLAIMPIGAYNPWIYYHCTPEQAWRMGNDAGAERFLPIHHQTFSLSREPRLEPIQRFQYAASRSQDRVVIRNIGEEFRLA